MIGNQKIDLPPGYGKSFLYGVTKAVFNFCFPELRTTQQGQVYFYHIPTSVSTWHDPRLPKDLAPLCLALDHVGPLPSGWEMRQTATGRVS